MDETTELSFYEAVGAPGADAGEPTPTGTGPAPVTGSASGPLAVPVASSEFFSPS